MPVGAAPTGVAAPAMLNVTALYRLTVLSAWFVAKTKLPSGLTARAVGRTPSGSASIKFPDATS
jgi:hypothetical protein